MRLLDIIDDPNLSSSEKLLQITCILGEEDINQTNERGQTPLFLAIKKGEVSIVALLLKAGANVEHSAGEMKPLHFAAVYGHLPIVKMFLENGVPVDQLDDKGCTPLGWASQKDYVDIMEVLMTAGANPNHLDRDEQTPLHQAAYFSAICSLSRLLALPDILVNLMDKDRRTPLELYLEGIRDGDFLEEEGPPTPDEYKIMQDILKVFLEKGADLDAALKRLGLEEYAAEIRAGNLFAGIDLMQNIEAPVRNFIRNGQSTHNALVHKTVYLSSQALYERYGNLPSLMLQMQIVAAAKRHGALDETKQFLRKMYHSENEIDIPYWSAGLGMREAVICMWKAIHDKEIRYRSFTSIEKDIADAEDTFFKTIKLAVKEDQCVHGGYYNQLMSACAVSQVPGVYVIRMDSEKEAIVEEMLLGKLKPMVAFTLASDEEKEKILSQEETYQQFIQMLIHNYAIYRRYGKNEQIIVDANYLSKEKPVDDWMWFAVIDYCRITEQYEWSRIQFKTAWEAKIALKKSPIAAQLLEDEHLRELSGWAHDLQSDDLAGVWERMGNYYDAQCAQVREGKQAKATVQAMLIRDSKQLITLLKDAECIDFVQDFFKRTLESLAMLDDNSLQITDTAVTETIANGSSDIEEVLPPSSPPFTLYHEHRVVRKRIRDPEQDECEVPDICKPRLER